MGEECWEVKKRRQAIREARARPYLADASSAIGGSKGGMAPLTSYKGTPCIPPRPYFNTLDLLTTPTT